MKEPHFHELITLFLGRDWGSANPPPPRAPCTQPPSFLAPSTCEPGLCSRFCIERQPPSSAAWLGSGTPGGPALIHLDLTLNQADWELLTFLPPLFQKLTPTPSHLSVKGGKGRRICLEALCKFPVVSEFLSLISQSLQPQRWICLILRTLNLQRG